MADSDFKSSLRKKAEQLMDRLPDRLNKIETQEIKDLIEELHVHQIELEIQNEELILVQRNLEKNRVRFVNLFNNAPVGYVVLNSVGIIEHFNSTFLTMVKGLDPRRKGQAFADLLLKEDAETFRARYKAFFKNPEGKQVRARIDNGDSPVTHVLLEGRHQADIDSPSGNDVGELLLTVTEITELEEARKRTNEALATAHQRKEEVAALLMASRAVLDLKDFEATARKIFDVCTGVIGAVSGYIALLSEDGSENEVLFLEDGGLPCTVDPELPMPIRGLREEAYRECRVVYDNQFMGSDWKQFLPEGHVHLDNVMFAPMVIKDKTVGVIGLANKPGGFTENDARIAEGFGELTAIALKNARLRDKRDLAEQEKLELIDELQKALANVKTLKGLIPICSHCKKIRDDQGYWNQLEDYLDQHSDAKLSHGICRDCARKHYPGLNLYED
ncbi:MAG: GAF domain-containing protein [Desulfobacterales bacterium]|nr:GAF domain-containing protein [Desulfobacterales bacterium]